MTKKKTKPLITSAKKEYLLNNSKKAIENKKNATICSFKLIKRATPAELILKEAMIERGILFDFQKPFANDKCAYIVDFYFTTEDNKGFAIECDGNQHYTKKGWKKDNIRTKHLARYFNIEVIRFPNKKVVNQIRIVIDELMDLQPLTIHNSYL